MGAGSVTKVLLEGEAAPRELLVCEEALDGRLDVELLADVRILADQLAGLARHFPLGCLAGLPEVDRTSALGCLVRDPGLEAKPRDVLERIDRLVAQVAPQLSDRRLRVGEIPEDESK
jgi:hypothetical protein